MAEYKVPQDVEAEDKILGPFSFRQFIYLIIALGLVGVAYLLFMLFPLLVLIPVPFILLFVALALPLRKEQPMEAYLGSVVRFYLRPRKRIWTAGQRNNKIIITAPKIVEDSRTRNISGEEATNRLSFLADIVDSGGRSIKDNITSSNMRDDLVAEAESTADIFENNRFDMINVAMKKDESARHEELIREMRAAIDNNNSLAPTSNNKTITHNFITPVKPTISVPSIPTVQQIVAPMSTPAPMAPIVTQPAQAPAPMQVPASAVIESLLQTPPQPPQSVQPTSMRPPVKTIHDSAVVVKPNTPDIPAKETAHTQSMKNLAENKDYSIETIAKEAKRIKGKEEGEVFIALH